jgi:hypothetical protein
MRVSFVLDEVDCQMLERANPHAREALRSSISLDGTRRRVIAETRVAEAWRDWFRAAGRARAVEAIESGLPQPGIRNSVST